MELKKASEQIRIKTLEEIRQEKAAKSQPRNDGHSDDASEINKTVTTKAKGIRRAITITDSSIAHVKMFSEILNAREKRQEEQDLSPKKAKHTVEKAPGKSHADPNTTAPGPETTNVGEVRVKTLEEIRREKAVRIQAQQALEAENKKSSGSEENGVKKPQLLRINKLASQSNATSEKSAEVTEKPLKTPTAAPETSPTSSNNVKVKTFEEIMREKRLRKQEMEEQTKTSSEAKPSEKQTADGTLKRKTPAKVSLTPPSSTALTPDTTSSTQEFPVRKLIPLRSKAASLLNTTTTSGTTATTVTTVTLAPLKQSSSPWHGETESQPQSSSGFREVPEKKSPIKQARAAPQGPAALHTANTKVRPKLNVKPSVVKPAVHVKPGQKRRGAERSAVAAVKPLNTTTSAVLEEPLQEMACRDRQVFPSPSAEAQLSSAVPRSPSTLPDSGSSSSPLREELQTVPVFKQSPSQETKPTVSVAAPKEACTVPQSPVLRSTNQPKTRRPSAVVCRTTSTSSAAFSISGVDDFEELINEFTDDHLEEDMDPGIAEDDLLQELSEMIDS
uniref:Zinc finger CCCH domain-containing protein 11A n=2 Tax=Monopterus albus TaxID=43700 RepID=A0A3Q3JPN1_MONAL